MKIRLLAFILSFVFIFSCVSVFLTMPYGYVPIGNFAEVNGAQIEYLDGVMTTTKNGEKHTFVNRSLESSFNGTPVTLGKAPVIINDVMYVDYEDISYIFENDGVYPEAKKAAVINAYYYMYSNKIPSISMALVDNDQQYTWTMALGYKSVEGRQLATEDTTYFIGSISKVFTAMSVFKLVEEGKINLDEKVSAYIPEFTINPHPVYGGDYRDITVRMLLAHVSGIPTDDFSDFYSHSANNEEYMNSFIERLASQYMDNTSGNRWVYANSGYVLLGVLVAKVAGYENYFQGFIDFADENIFVKMGLDYTSFEMNAAMAAELAGSYPTSEAERAKELFVNPVPAGNVVSNAKDMAVAMHYLLGMGSYNGNTVLDSSSVEQMKASSGYNMDLNSDIDMGLGLYSINEGGLNLTGHDGAITYFNSDMRMNFENGLGFFATANSTSSMGIPTDIATLSLITAVGEKTGKFR